MSKSRCWPILALVFVSSAPLFAQGAADPPVKMTPEFPLTFPLAKVGDDVTVKFPVMINPTTVLKPGMILRTLYVIQQSYDSTDLNVVHSTDQSEAYARSNPSTDGGEKLPYELAHQLEGYRRTVWTTPTNFELAMAQYPTDLMHLIYQPKPRGNEHDLLDRRFNFFDGMFVGQPDGSRVVVLAVEDDSKANQAGLKAGDEIVAVGGTPTRHDLATFAAAFATARQNARDTNAATYPLTIRSPGESGTHAVNVAMPPTIKSQLLQGF